MLVDQLTKLLHARVRFIDSVSMPVSTVYHVRVDSVSNEQAIYYFDILSEMLGGGPTSDCKVLIYCYPGKNEKQVCFTRPNVTCQTLNDKWRLVIDTSNPCSKRWVGN
jgi:hypothetical protein